MTCRRRQRDSRSCCRGSAATTTTHHAHDGAVTTHVDVVGQNCDQCVLFFRQGQNAVGSDRGGTLPVVDGRCAVADEEHSRPFGGTSHSIPCSRRVQYDRRGPVPLLSGHGMLGLVQTAVHRRSDPSHARENLRVLDENQNVSPGFRRVDRRVHDCRA
ncbi:hypothetical protein [Rhodococcus erythropolis]|uniref:hypothetical protein n=1 Tax=Rhodococcus erythropolis TaxID=1833 RepID=UPI0020364AD5|nr:hypothetical protein [Rhodococcus erythropolis]